MLAMLAASYIIESMVPAVWIEHTTYRLQGGCSTAELSRRENREIAEPAGGCKIRRRFPMNPPGAAAVRDKPGKDEGA